MQLSNKYIFYGSMIECHVLPPTVASSFTWNCPLTNLNTKLDVPTADSPKGNK